MTFFHSIESVLSVYVIIGIGYFLAKRGILTKDTGGQFAWLVVNLTFPCYVIATLPDQFSAKALGDSLLGIFIALAATAVLYPIGYFIAKLLKIAPKRKHIFVAMIVFSNMIFIGLPVNYALYGDKSIPYVLQYYVANTIIFWTLGTYFIRLGLVEGTKPSIDIKMILNTPIISLLIAVILIIFDIKMPFVINYPLEIIGNMTTPLATLFIGIVFADIKLKDLKFSKDMAGVLAGRFILAPAAVYIPLVFTNFPPLMREVFFIQAAMPIMNQITIYARYYGADYEYPAIITVWSFVISMFMIPVYVFLFQSGIL